MPTASASFEKSLEERKLREIATIKLSREYESFLGGGCSPSRFYLPITQLLPDINLLLAIQLLTDIKFLPTIYLLPRN